MVLNDRDEVKKAVANKYGKKRKVSLSPQPKLSKQGKAKFNDQDSSVTSDED